MFAIESVIFKYMENLSGLLSSANENFEAKKFAYSTGFFLKFKANFATFDISGMEGDCPGSKGCHFKNLQQLPFYNEQYTEKIKNLVNWITCSGKIKLKSLVKICFVHFAPDNEVFGFNNVLQNIYLHPDENNSTSQEGTFHLCFIRGLNEPFQEKVIISTLTCPNNDYMVKWVADSLNFKILLKNHEYDILKYIVQGFSAGEISQVLHLSPHTVNDSKKNLYKTFNASNIYQLIRHAKEKKFI